MELYPLVKVAHILSATILFGTGAGIAFFKFRASFTDNLHEKYFAARNTVLADSLFTAPSVIIQPLTGFWLIQEGGHEFSDLWLLITYGLYLLAGACWLPVVWIQIRLRNIVRHSVETDTPLPEEYEKLFRLWFILGWPAFGGLVAIFGLMVIKPI